MSKLQEWHGTDRHGKKMKLCHQRGFIYYVRVTIPNSGGKRKLVSTGKRNLKDGERRAAEIVQQVNDQASGWDKKGGAASPLLLDYYAKTYRPIWVVGEKTCSTRQPGHYRDDDVFKTLGKIEDPRFQNTHLSDWTPSLCQAWVKVRRKMTYGQVKKTGAPSVHLVSEGTVRREVNVLQAVFERARKDKLIPDNPWAEVETGAPKVRDRVLLPDEETKLMAQLTPRWQRFLLFLLGTGLRLTEVLKIDEKTGLKFTEHPHVHVVRKSRGLVKKEQDVPLLGEYLLDTLQAQLTEDGELWHQSPTRAFIVLSTAAQRAGIPHVNNHTMRHTFATRYLQAGGGLYALSQILGHSSIAITEKVYAHLVTADLHKLSAHVKLGPQLVKKPAKVFSFGANG